MDVAPAGAAVAEVASLGFATTVKSVPPGFLTAAAAGVVVVAGAAVVYALIVASAAIGLDRFLYSIWVLVAVAIVAAAAVVAAAASDCPLGYASAAYWCHVGGFVLEVDD